jgi:hypothetical protein
MTKHLALIALFIATTLSAATSQRAFVSAASGSDTNPCTRTLPCRNFNAALPVTSAGGEIIVLDSGGYGPVTVAQAVSITAPDGVYAGVTAFTGTGLQISGGAADSVVLRGLNIIGLGATEGIDWSSGNDLHVENCVVSGFNSGTAINAHSNTTSDTTLLISGTTIRRGGSGVMCDGGSQAGFALINIDDSRFEGTNFDYVGTDFLGKVKATITRTVATGLGAGVYVDGAAVQVTLDWSVMTQNGAGIQANAGLIRVTNSILTNNGVAFAQEFTGVIESGKNNTMRGNENPGIGTLTLFDPM